MIKKIYQHGKWNLIRVPDTALFPFPRKFLWRNRKNWIVTDSQSMYLMSGAMLINAQWSQQCTRPHLTERDTGSGRWETARDHQIARQDSICPALPPSQGYAPYHGLSIDFQNPGSISTNVKTKELNWASWWRLQGSEPRTGWEPEVLWDLHITSLLTVLCGWLFRLLSSHTSEIWFLRVPWVGTSIVDLAFLLLQPEMEQLSALFKGGATVFS